MNSKECEEQLESLVEAWQLNEADLNQTDIEAIKHLMLENQIQHKEILELKKQLEYLRSGEYLNQLKFERNMLEDIVQDKELSNEVYSMKEMMKANTKLCEKLELSESVIKEIREYMKEKEKDGTLWSVKSTDEILQILDKGEQ